LVDFFGKARAAEALEANTKEDARVKSDVIKRIKECAKSVSSLKPEELKARREGSEPKWYWTSDHGLWVKMHECPACGSKGRLTVKHVSDRPAEIVEAAIYIDSICSPRKFECGVCGLTITGTPELRVAGLADEIVRSTENDPAEYFDIEVAGNPYDDYGNE
jgi:hypothetical protein